MLPPIQSFHYNAPHHADDNCVAHAYCDTSVPNPRRKLVVYQSGGGWTPQSGTVAGGPWAPNPDTILGHLYGRGHVIVLCGYSVLRTGTLSTPKERGVFDHAHWRYDARGLPRVDGTKLAWRHSELDTLLCVQTILHQGITGLPELDRRPGSWIGVARSSGSHNLAWVGLAPGLEDPNAADPRLRFPSRPLCLVLSNFVGTAAALVQNAPTYHLADANGNTPAKVGDVPPLQHARCWSLRWVEKAGPLPPVFLSGDGTTVNPGPWTWGSILHTLTTPQLHSDDQVLAFRAVGQHNPASRFHVGPVRDPKQLDLERAQWVLSLVERFDA